MRFLYRYFNIVRLTKMLEFFFKFSRLKRVIRFRRYLFIFNNEIKDKFSAIKEKTDIRINSDIRTWAYDVFLLLF